MFLWFPYGILIIGTTSFFVFSYEKEKQLLDFVLAFFALVVLFFDLILLKVIPPGMDLSFIYKENYLFYTVPKILLLFFLYTSFYFAKVTVFRYRQELSRLNNQLNDLNRNLENKVRDRTVQLDQQNKRIKDLTFTNSHIIRASVARIIGLVNFSSDNLTQDDKDFCYQNIKASALELDKETRIVSDKLAEEY